MLDGLAGYTGKILRINLTEGRSTIFKVRKEDAVKFIGGSGLAAKIIWEELNPQINPLSPENLLVFMTGPLEGTLVPCSSRYMVAAKSPLTGAWGEAHASGFWGPELKRAGYDGIILEGKASKPIYIKVENEDIKLLDASHIWGMGCLDTEKILKADHGDKFRVLCIGPAGEHLVRYASVIGDGGRAAGRCGMGAVMGFKNLKAIIVRGTGKVEISDIDRLRSMIRRLYPVMMSFPTTQIHSAYGTNGEMEPFYEYGDVPIKHFTRGEWEGISKISGEAMAEKIVKGQIACPGCPIGCTRYIKIDYGQFAGLEGKGPEYETVASFGSLLLNDEIEVIAKANELCNQYGLDTISTGVSIAFAMELFERRIIDENDTGGLKLQWGNKDVILRLVEEIGERKGFGDILAEGVRRAAEIIGRGSEKYAMHVKGLEMPMHDPRAFKGMGLQYATSNRGACHMQGFVLRIEQGERMVDLKIYERVNRFETKGKGRIVALMQDWHEILDSMILCKFLAVSPGHVASFYTLVTGYRLNLQEMLKAGDRIFNLKRLFNVRCGVRRKDD
ncbi:TPA: aldehyde ferredoxin oxidoreductase, partial [Candidatus Bathyarchaeota archaeon]|nr:aldehyde ferredoxin oxidoreductase [Candidatus Bathyarchaeota archaeon]